jgi:serine/threonine-protein kinase
MEFIEGASLTDLIEGAGTLPPRRAASIVHQTGDALQVAHDAGIVHRDLKPDNIMVARHRDGSDLVKVVDFGIAKASASDAQKVTKTGLVVGTPEYMSPEQLAGDRLDGRSDIYALGLVAFNCLTGTLPFAANSAQEAMIMRLTDVPRTLAEVRPEVAWPAALQATLDLALARDAADRYQSAAQFGREFAAACAALPEAPSAEAGTMILGASDVPATRVARPGGATAAAAGVRGETRAAAPAAPSTATTTASARSRGPLIGGGIGAVVLVAGLVWTLGSSGSGSRATPADSIGIAPAAIPAAAGAAPTTTGEPVQLYTKPVDGAPTVPSVPASAPQATPPTTTPAEPTGAELAARLPALLREAQGGNGARVLRDIAALQPRLTGQPLAESYYVQMIAYTSLEDQEGVCAAAKQVVARHETPARVQLARRASDLMQCDGGATP